MRKNIYTPLYRMMKGKKVLKAIPMKKRVHIQKPIIMPPIVMVTPFFII